MKREDSYVFRIYNAIQDKSTFPDFESFLEYSTGKYRIGFTVYRIDASKPYSPENCYWYYRDKKAEDVVSQVCEGCTAQTSACGTNGCMKYREYFVKNWNKNICRAKKPEVNTQKIFRYEHPDLVREGIVFENCQSIP